VTLQLIGPTSGEKIAVHDLPAVIGRDASADVQFDDFAMAPYQCMIARSGRNGLTVWNLREEFPIWVNDQQALKAVLRPGDRLTMGGTQFIVEYCLPGQCRSASSLTLEADADTDNDPRSTVAS
jgi:hypothetical protein